MTTQDFIVKHTPDGNKSGFMGDLNELLSGEGKKDEILKLIGSLQTEKLTFQQSKMVAKIAFSVYNLAINDAVHGVVQSLCLASVDPTRDLYNLKIKQEF